ncbi:hypothetical protein [Lentzea sp. NBRC 105346]|uniref:hypothetical protein n=1 Tax=Lentzea sp. NBRC 105346 TaxID=3032205 RepID=UPI002552779C|nr:hypothetical protein [Lentzea sp. NBRC 105346]
MFGQFDLQGSKIRNLPGVAIQADGLHVEQDMRCSDKFLAEGVTKMVGAAIDGQFICGGACFCNPGNVALELSGLIVKEHVFWQDGFTVDGQASLRGARVEGRLDCSGATFRNPGKVAVEAVGLTVDQKAKFSNGCRVEGQLNLTGCKIGGWLDFAGGRFLHKGGKALDLARASVAQNLIFRDGCFVEGQILLAGAEVSGSIWAEGGHFENVTGTVLDATGLRVGRDALFRVKGDRFVALGQIVLNDARIEGRLDFTGASLEKRSDALKCDRVRVGQSVIFDNVTSDGSVQMSRAMIAADLSFVGASIAGEVSLKGTCIDGALKLRFQERKPPRLLNLCRVRVASLDDRQTALPKKMELDGLVYGTLRDTEDAKTRILWLHKNHKYVPQVYLQLASSYSAAGRHDLATKVLMAREDARFASGTGQLAWLNRLFGRVFKATVGYGYKPFRVLWWLVALQAAGWAIFSLLNLNDSNFTPVRNDIDNRWFNPFLYTTDLLLPLVSIRHRDLWIPHGGGAVAAVAFTVMGWILAICLVTGVGRLFKRDT